MSALEAKPRQPEPSGPESTEGPALSRDRWLSLDSLRTPVVVLNTGNRILVLNSAAEDLFGRGSRRMHGQSVNHLLTAVLGDPEQPDMPADFGGRDELLTALHGVSEAGSVYVREVEFTSADGREHVADLVISEGSTDAGERFRLLEFQLLDWHRERVEQSRDSTLSMAHTQVLRGLAHEINNPLGGIRGAAQLLQRDTDGQERAALCQLIIDEVDRLAGLLKRFAGELQVNPSSVDVHQVLQRVTDLVSGDDQWAVEVQRDYDPSLPQFELDPDLLTQALLNLIRNAAQFAQRHIILRTRVAHQVALAGTQHPLVLRIEVEDDGPGVDPELEELVFLPLVSGRAQGTGLGLSLSQAIARAHGGLIRFRSRPGCTVFSLLIPICAGADHG